MDELLAVFVQESREQLQALEAGLIALDRGDHDPDTLNGVFRAAHTIKGGAGVVECDFIVEFTHVVENTLDALRNGSRELSPPLIAALLQCSDHLSDLLDLLEQSATPDAECLACGQQRLANLGNPTAPTPTPTAAATPPVAANSDRHWHISVRFGLDTLRHGMDPVSFLHYLEEMGEIVGLATIYDQLPALAEYDPEGCYLGFEIDYASTADKASIERVFDFVRDDCLLHIIPPDSKVDDFIHLIEQLPETPPRIGEILVQVGALTEKELQQALHTQSQLPHDDDHPAPKVGEILVEHHHVPPQLVEAAAGKQGKLQAGQNHTLRIQADKLDKLIDLVGELVIAGASARLLAREIGQTRLSRVTQIMSRLVEEIRDSALELRMVQIGETFNRFHRVVRDLSHELNKEVELNISGAETELDKSVVEKISDPLMHLVRNAIDHGIESPEQRLAAGKPARGKIGFNAYHDSGSIVIEVRDDGAGVNRQKVLKRAIERGLVSANQSLSDTEILNLLLEPGFSTADKVSNVSGRGVGMDVVKRNIQSLRGRIDMESVEGQGSRFMIRLPLTLAIIDGFHVAIAASTYILPLDSVVRCLEFKDAASDRDYLDFGGEALPFVRLRDLFRIDAPMPPRQNVIVVQYAGQKAGLVVDQLLGESQTVIKPLSSMFQHMRGIGGATILGSGEVALILDVQALVQLAATRETDSLSVQREPAVNQPA